MPIDRFQARQIAMQVVANAIGYRIIAKSSADGNSDQVEYHSGDPDQEVGAQPVRRMEPFGLHSVPPEGLPAAVVFANASPNAGMIVGVDGTKYFPADAANGDVYLYCKTAGATIKIAGATGAITLTTPGTELFSANGTTDFEVRGSTYRTAEDVLWTAISVVLVAIGTFATAVGVAVPAVAGAAVTLNTAITTATTAITTFKNGASSYLSTKNKLG